MTIPLAIRRILLPTDFSDASELAKETAASLARHFGARLTVLHVVPPVTDPELRRAALRATAKQFSPDVSVDTDVVTGIPARQIVAYARRHHIDLIVMGTHGRTGVSYALLGSVTEAVVRRAPCHVLTVPAGVRTADAPTAADEESVTRCIVCGASSADLMCEMCRARIRGEALERKQHDEPAGRV